jgi:hypothetical protein
MKSFTEFREEKQRLDPKCWDGYKKKGTKMKGETRVNDCVKEEEVEEGFSSADRPGQQPKKIKRPKQGDYKNYVDLRPSKLNAPGGRDKVKYVGEEEDYDKPAVKKPVSQMTPPEKKKNDERRTAYNTFQKMRRGKVNEESGEEVISENPLIAGAARTIASRAAAKKGAGKVGSAVAGQAASTAASSLMKKEENLQELSPETLSSYKDKANKQMPGLRDKMHQPMGKNNANWKKNLGNLKKRKKGIETASKKLDEVSDELVKKVAHKRNQNVSMAGSKADYDRRDPNYQDAAKKQDRNQKLRFARGAKAIGKKK